MSITSAKLKKFQEEYLQTSGICFQFTFSKTRKKWVGYCFPKRFEAEEFNNLLTIVTDFIENNRTAKPIANYQFQFKFWAKK
jgi:hypothetical protein